MSQIEAIGKSPDRTMPSENRRSGNQGVRNTRHQNSRNLDLRYPDKIWTVRSHKIWTVEKSKGDFSRFGILKGKNGKKPVALYHKAWSHCKKTKGQFKNDRLPLAIDKSMFLRSEVNTNFSLYFFCNFFFEMASSSNLGPTQGPILLGKNYEFWSLRMRSFLQEKECWEPVDFGYVEPDPAALTAMTNA
jgi:hypothetical protein